MGYSKAELLHKLSLNTWFGSLPLADRKAMLSAAALVPVRAGDVLYHKGEISGGFYGVVDGAFKVSSLGEDGREGILSIMEEGNWFGETTLLDGLPRPHDVTALHEGVVAVILPSDFQTLLQRAGFAQGIGALLCTRVRALYGLVEDAMLRSTRARVARRLLALARGDTTMAPQARTVITVSHEALAMMLGVTRQTLAKELKYLVREGVLSLGYGHIDILSPDALLREAALT
jgi:CRP/FNR family cyclic AMP-dependent transcriptional regulator